MRSQSQIWFHYPTALHFSIDSRWFVVNYKYSQSEFTYLWYQPSDTWIIWHITSMIIMFIVMSCCLENFLVAVLCYKHTKMFFLSCTSTFEKATQSACLILWPFLCMWKGLVHCRHLMRLSFYDWIRFSQYAMVQSGKLFTGLGYYDKFC